jgi:DtxR family manganese transport transcriptional regulator
MTGTPNKTIRPRNSRDGFVYTRTRNQNELAEDYVELIDDLIQEKGEARATDIAQRLGVSHVTVSKAIGRLKDAGLVTSEPYRSIFLTEPGQIMARMTRERHQVVVDFLAALGVPADIAAIDAEGIEHHVSEATMLAMRQFIQSASAR